MEVFVAIVSNVLIPIIVSYVFWILTFVITKTKVVFSDKIERRTDLNDSDNEYFRIRICNCGNRDLMDVSLSAKLRILDQDKANRNTYLDIGDGQFLPVLKGKDKNNPKVYMTYLPEFI